MEIKTIYPVDIEKVNSIITDDTMLSESDGDLVRVTDYYIDKTPVIIDDYDFDSYNGYYIYHTDTFNTVSHALEKGIVIYLVHNDFYYVLYSFQIDTNNPKIYCEANDIYTDFSISIYPSSEYSLDDLYFPSGLYRPII